MQKPNDAPPAPPRSPWNPQDIADDILHRHREPPRPHAILTDEVEAVSALAAPRAIDRVDVVWISGGYGWQALLWPMRLGMGDDA